MNEWMNDEIRTCIFWRFSCAWTRLTRSATFRNLLRGFFTSQVATADLHLLRASMELSLFSNSKSFNKLSISLTIKTTQLSSLWVEKIWLIDWFGIVLCVASVNWGSAQTKRQQKGWNDRPGSLSARKTKLNRV